MWNKLTAALGAAVLGLALCVAGILPASAQSNSILIVSSCGNQSLNAGTGYLGIVTVDTTGKLCVNASVSASISPFTPSTSGARGTQLAVTTADSSGSLPTNGGAVVVTNTGSNPMFCNVNGIAATTSDQEISASGGWFNFGIPAGATTLHCIATGGSTTANTVGGSGLATGTGGGSGGGGSSGAVFGPTAVGSANIQPPVVVGGTQDATQTGTVAVWKVLSGAGWMNMAQWAGTNLGSPSAYGTSPGAVNVPGVNAFVTNTPAVTQSGTWTVQPGNTANTTPWLVSATQSGTWNITNISGTVSLPTGAATSANQTTANTSLSTIATNSGTQATAANQTTINTSIGTTNTNLGTLHTDLTTLNTTAASPGTLSSQYPSGAVPLTASATGTTAATTATLAGTTGKTTFICGYSIRANATANANVTDTITGVISGTMSSALWVPANTAGLGVDEQIFTPCIPASATNTAIAAVSGAPGTGGVVTVKAWGYQL